MHIWISWVFHEEAADEMFCKICRGMPTKANIASFRTSDIFLEKQKWNVICPTWQVAKFIF